jgi:mono/diheme cytochrome c family protein/uncharacterized membrane protein
MGMMFAAQSALAAAHASGAPAPFDLRKFLAPFHAVLLHYPIGFVTLVCILEIYAYFRPSPQLRQTIGFVTILAAASAGISAALGYLRAGGGGYDERTLRLHKFAGMGVTVLAFLIIFFQSRSSRSSAGRGWLLAYRGLLGGTLGMLIYAGHLGGSLTHGVGYLTKDAPDFMKEFIEAMETEAEPVAAAVATDEKQKFYLEKVQPIFEAKCYPCHGPDKQKSGYRLDREAVIFKGGESDKPAVRPGAPLESNLVRLILLPGDHDDVMPPAGKELLTAEEIGTIINWIRSGAAFVEGAVATKP